MSKLKDSLRVMSEQWLKDKGVRERIAAHYTESGQHDLAAIERSVARTFHQCSMELDEMLMR